MNRSDKIVLGCILLGVLTLGISLYHYEKDFTHRSIELLSREWVSVTIPEGLTRPYIGISGVACGHTRDETPNAWVVYTTNDGDFKTVKPSRMSPYRVVRKNAIIAIIWE